MDPNLAFPNIQPGSLQSLSENKIASFTIGNQKKSRFQKAREAQELKKKEEELAAAKVYESFVASFDADEENGKTFVRGGVKGESESHYGRSSNRGDVYKLSSNQGKDPNAKKNNDVESFLKEIKGHDNNSDQNHLSAHGVKKKRGAIDDLFEEIKQRQESGVPIVDDNSTNKGATLTGSMCDPFDTTTTNLFVSNVHPNVTEEELEDLFGRYGSISSIKIMWPRSDEEKSRGRNCGFVSFRRRRDAEDALNELHDSLLHEKRISVGWGKSLGGSHSSSSSGSSSRGGGDVDQSQYNSHASQSYTTTPTTLTPAPAPAIFRPPPPQQPLPPQPLVQQPPPPPFVTSYPSAPPPPPPPQSQPPPPPPLPPHPSMTSPLNPSHMFISEPPGGVGSTMGSSVYNSPHVLIVSPDEETDTRDTRYTKELIDLVARYVATDGEPFEKALLNSEQYNPDFQFMVHTSDSTPTEDNDGSYSRRRNLHLYYRWRVYANLMEGMDKQHSGHSHHLWRVEPFQMSTNSVFYIPPPHPVAALSAIDDDNEEDRGGNSDNREEDRGGDGYYGRGYKRNRGGKYVGSEEEEEEEGYDDRRKRRGRVGDEDDDRGDRRKKRDTETEDRVKYKGLTGAQISRLKEKERKEKELKLRSTSSIAEGLALYRPYKCIALSSEDTGHLNHLLQNGILSRRYVKEVMGFCIDHILPTYSTNPEDDDFMSNRKALELSNDLVTDISMILIRALCKQTTPWSVKISILFVVSDILMNSTTIDTTSAVISSNNASQLKNLSRFRNIFQEYLPEIFEHWGYCFRNFVSGRMTARNIEDRVLAVLLVWKNWSIYPPAYIYGLESAFLCNEADMSKVLAARALDITDKNRKQGDTSGRVSSKIAVDEEASNEGAVDSEYLLKLMRSAKFNGICVSLSAKLCGEDQERVVMGCHELAERLSLAEAYGMHKEGGGRSVQKKDKKVKKEHHHSLSNSSRLASVNTYGQGDDISDDVDDIDGVPMEGGTVMTVESDMSDDDDDIDGVPMEGGHFTIKTSSYQTTLNTGDDDVDGIPMGMEGDDDVDGVPMKEVSDEEEEEEEEEEQDSQTQQQARMALLND